MVSFAVQQLLVWFSPTWFFILLPLLLLLNLKNICQYWCQGNYCLFFSRKFMVSGLMFKSSIYFDLFFCACCKIVLQVYSFTCGYPVFQAPFIVLSPLYILGFFVIICYLFCIFFVCVFVHLSSFISYIIYFLVFYLKTFKCQPIIITWTKLLCMEYYYILDTVLSPSLILLETIISVLQMEKQSNSWKVT